MRVPEPSVQAKSGDRASSRRLVRLRNWLSLPDLQELLAVEPVWAVWEQLHTIQ